LFQAYYGGEGRCEQDNGDDFNPGDLICGGCADVSRLQVSTHVYTNTCTTYLTSKFLFYLSCKPNILARL